MFSYRSYPPPNYMVEVSDNGRGIPVEIQPQVGRPAVEVVLTILHAGVSSAARDTKSLAVYTELGFRW